LITASRKKSYCGHGKKCINVTWKKIDYGDKKFITVTGKKINYSDGKKIDFYEENDSLILREIFSFLYRERT